MVKADSTSRRRVWRWLGDVVVVMAWGTSVLLAMLAALRLVAHDRTHALVLVNMFTAYVYLPAYAIGVFALWRRRGWLCVVSTVVVVMHLSWVLPGTLWAEPLPPLDGRPRLRVVSANLLVDNPNKQPLIRELLDSDADVLLLQELSQEWQDALESSDVAVQFPHHVEKIREWPFGVGVRSRLPLEDTRIVDVADFPMVRVVVHVAGHALSLYDIHTLTPRFAEWVEPWSQQLAAALAAARTESMPVVVAGDFNMTPHAAWYSRYRAAGLREVHDERGQGGATSWPNGVLPLPEVRLDHAFLAGSVVCTSVRQGRGRGTDHRPLVFDVALTTEQQ